MRFFLLGGVSTALFIFAMFGMSAGIGAAVAENESQSYSQVQTEIDNTYSEMYENISSDMNGIVYQLFAQPPMKVSEWATSYGYNLGYSYPGVGSALKQMTPIGVVAISIAYIVRTLRRAKA